MNAMELVEILGRGHQTEFVKELSAELRRLHAENELLRSQVRVNDLEIDELKHQLEVVGIQLDYVLKSTGIREAENQGEKK